MRVLISKADPKTGNRPSFTGVPSPLSAAVLIMGFAMMIGVAILLLGGPVTRWFDDIPRIFYELREKLRGVAEFLAGGFGGEPIGQRIDVMELFDSFPKFEGPLHGRGVDGSHGSGSIDSGRISVADADTVVRSRC